jgi:hypothetical protein
MAAGLVKLAQEDPSFHFSRDEEINQTVIEGMGELHLEIIVDRLKREYKVICFILFTTIFSINYSVTMIVFLSLRLSHISFLHSAVLCENVCFYVDTLLRSHYLTFVYAGRS